MTENVMGAVEFVAEAEVIKAADAVTTTDGIVVSTQSLEDCDTEENTE